MGPVAVSARAPGGQEAPPAGEPVTEVGVEGAAEAAVRAAPWVPGPVAVVGAVWASAPAAVGAASVWESVSVWGSAWASGMTGAVAR
ncbi:hypothetical protein GCM10027072_69930 [Streptomyces bullii]